MIGTVICGRHTLEDGRDGPLVEADEVGEPVEQDGAGLRDEDLLHPGPEGAAHALRHAAQHLPAQLNQVSLRKMKNLFIF